MLDWLFRWFEHSAPRPVAPRSKSAPAGWTVSLDEKAIRIQEPGGALHVVPWGSIAQVTIRTEHSAQRGFDLAWVLILRDGRASVVLPVDAEGEHELVKVMQARLPGFDNMAVVEAMSAATDEDFLVWPAPAAARET